MFFPGTALMEEHNMTGIQDSDVPIIRFENHCKQFAQVLANDNISFSIREGEVHCLLGENGAGKSTLAECLYGFYKPTSGLQPVCWKAAVGGNSESAVLGCSAPHSG